MNTVASGNNANLQVVQKNTLRPTEQFASRESAELVIGFCGAIGSGITDVSKTLTEVLHQANYEVKPIKISSLIREATEQNLIADKLDDSSLSKRYDSLQTAGNSLRKNFGNDILAEFAVREIAKLRTKEIPQDQPVMQYVPKRTAYLIDQLKHPDEIALLRTVYGRLFYLTGVLSLHDVRKNRLVDLGMVGSEAEYAIERDRKEPDKHGQQLERTIHLSDFFVRNNKPNLEGLRNSLTRFVGLMHGANGISPTKTEYGMYVAYAAGLRSACLSRQVGVSIQDKAGRIIATGCNDVPKYGGGLYGPEDGEADARCIHAGHCFNDQHKLKLMGQIRSVIASKLDGFAKVPPNLINEVADSIYGSTRIRDLIEFSRAVHAEMDAIVSVARGGNGSTIGATLFSTTFPCHSCARHIVAAGIDTVYFIEPYEKSLAKELHADAIALEATEEQSASKRVKFIQFEGISPRLYHSVFQPITPRKTERGEAIRQTTSAQRKVVAQYLDSYREFETKVVDHLDSITKK